MPWYHLIKSILEPLTLGNYVSPGSFQGQNKITLAAVNNIKLCSFSFSFYFSPDTLLGGQLDYLRYKYKHPELTVVLCM